MTVVYAGSSLLPWEIYDSNMNLIAAFIDKTDAEAYMDIKLS